MVFGLVKSGILMVKSKLCEERMMYYFYVVVILNLYFNSSLYNLFMSCSITTTNSDSLDSKFCEQKYTNPS